MKTINYEFYLSVTNALATYIVAYPLIFRSAAKIEKAFKLEEHACRGIHGLYKSYQKNQTTLRRLSTYIFVKKYWNDNLIFTNYNGEKITAKYITSVYIKHVTRPDDKDKAYALEKFMAK